MVSAANGGGGVEGVKGAGVCARWDGGPGSPGAALLVLFALAPAVAAHGLPPGPPPATPAVPFPHCRHSVSSMATELHEIARQRRPLAAAAIHGFVVAATAFVGIIVVQLAMRDALLADLRNYLGRTAEFTAASIDPVAHAALKDSAQTLSALYRRAAHPLEVLVRSNPDIRFAYTGVIRNDSMFFVLDGEPGPDRAYVMEPSAPTSGEREVWRSRRTVTDRAPSATEYGQGIRSYAPILDARGQMVAYVGITISASQHRAWLKRLDLASALGFGCSLLLALLTGLRVARSERLRLRAAADIVRAKELADHSAQVKSQFLANMSHEIRTPLNGVLGFTDLLSATPLSTEQRSYVQTLQRSGSALLGVVNDVLDFSRLEAHRVELVMEPVDANALVQEVVQLFQADATVRGIVVEARLPEQATILGDAARLRQILVNLVGNAVKFTPAGRVEVAVTAATGGADIGTLWEVCDSGIGIPPDKLSIIFESFAQVDGSASRRYGGTGLGLAISRELVALMGGQLQVESRVGQGSRFWFRLGQTGQSGIGVTESALTLVEQERASDTYSGTTTPGRASASSTQPRNTSSARGAHRGSSPK